MQKRTAVVCAAMMLCICGCSYGQNHISQQDAGNKALTENTEIQAYSASESTSDTEDDGYTYMGGAGNILQVDNRTLEETSLYQTDHITGAAVYHNYIYSIELEVKDSGVQSYLIRMKKDGSEEKRLATVDAGSYELLIDGNELTLADQTDPEKTIYNCYSLTENGDLVSDTPQKLSSIENMTKISDADENQYLMNPVHSMNNYGAVFYSTDESETGAYHIQEQFKDGTLKKMQTEMTGNLLFDQNYIYGVNTDGELVMISLSDHSVKTIGNAGKDYHITLLAQDGSWCYYVAGDTAEGSTAQRCRRMNLKSGAVEEFAEMQPYETICDFCIIKNCCFYISQAGSGAPEWVKKTID